MRLGAKLPDSGAAAMEPGIPAMARALEDAGPRVPVGQRPHRHARRHRVLLQLRRRRPGDLGHRHLVSRRPRRPRARRRRHARARLDTALLVLPGRRPVTLAKQAATIDVVSGRRPEPGVSAGWSREELEALGVPFAGRTTRLAEWMRIARDCWTGAPAPWASGCRRLPEGVLCEAPAAA